MYTLKISLRYPSSYEDSQWCNTFFFRSKEECFNYLESHYNTEDPDCRFNFEITTPSGAWQSL